jgi:hypothetical protein
MEGCGESISPGMVERVVGRAGRRENRSEATESGRSDSEEVGLRDNSLGENANEKSIGV